MRGKLRMIVATKGAYFRPVKPLSEIFRNLENVCAILLTVKLLSVNRNRVVREEGKNFSSTLQQVRCPHFFFARVFVNFCSFQG